MRKILILSCLVFWWLSSTAFANPLRLCSDDNFWYPFTFHEKRVAKGLHIDVIKQALVDLGYEFVIDPIPWKRCLAAAKQGSYDGVATASFKPERAEYMIYPPESDLDQQSRWRVTQVEFVVVSHLENPYNFDGNVKTLPPPVRVALGYSVGDDLQKQGIRIKSNGKGDVQNLKHLLRDKTGVVVTLPEVFNLMGKMIGYRDALKLHKTPIKSKSYFIPFSKKGTLSEKEMLNIWQRIIEIREDPVVMSQFLLKY